MESVSHRCASLAEDCPKLGRLVARQEPLGNFLYDSVRRLGALTSQGTRSLSADGKTNIPDWSKGEKSMER